MVFNEFEKIFSFFRIFSREIDINNQGLHMFTYFLNIYIHIFHSEMWMCWEIIQCEILKFDSPSLWMIDKKERKKTE